MFWGHVGETELGASALAGIYYLVVYMIGLGCSTCRNSRKWLEEHQISFKERHIVEQRPTETELKGWIERSGLPIVKFFNTSGLVYKSLQLKDKLSGMSDEEKIRLLVIDGKLIKRPLLVGG